MKEYLQAKTLFAGLQWFFFMFVNIIVVPVTIGEAFALEQHDVIFTIQMSFVVTGLVCMAQGLFGHGRPLLEGPSGLWWGLILTLVVTSSAQNMSLEELAGSIAVGIIVSGVITVLVGVTGIGFRLTPLFNDSVMGVFMMLLGLTLIHIFFKGMLGLPFGLGEAADLIIDVPVSILAFSIVILVMIISIKASARIRSFAVLIGIIVGWIAYVLIFGKEVSEATKQLSLSFFPLGKPIWNTGIVLTIVLAGLLNLSNTFAALKGSDDLYGEIATSKQFAKTFSFTGLATIVAGLFGLVPYAPYVSSIGFLRQTNIFDRAPFIIGSFLFFLLGIMPSIAAFFAQIPLSIGSAVLFVAYLQMFNSSLDFFKKVTFNTLNVYRAAMPVFIGAIIMMLPATAFESLPALVRPFLSNGLLVGVILAIILEQIINWDRLEG